MNNQYNSWCKWHPLKTVMLGKSYAPGFFEDIKNPKIRDCLQRIAIETEEDFQNYEKVLRDFGCDVIRPYLDPAASIMDNLNATGGFDSLIRPPAQVRDGQLVMGNEMLYTWMDHPSIKQRLDQYNSVDMFDYTIQFNDYNTDGQVYWGKTEPVPTPARVSEFDAPSVTCVGRHVYVNHDSVTAAGWQWLTSRYPDRKFIHVPIKGHADGAFHTLKEGVILSLLRYTQYQDTFPGWDVCCLPDQSWERMQEFGQLKAQNQGKWWLPGEEKNTEFTEYVEKWLSSWVGFVEESVFDVNVLMLDDKHVVVNNYNDQVFSYLKKHNIEPIICPFRHRYFWDGGLHCITLDLYREGSMEDYFSGQTQPISNLPIINNKPWWKNDKI